MEVSRSTSTATFGLTLSPTCDWEDKQCDTAFTVINPNRTNVMEKNAIKSASHNNVAYSLKQFLLVMKLTTLLLIIVLVQVSASGFGQKINLNEKNTPIKEVIQTIEKQSGYTFFYDTKDLPEARVTVRLRDASIDEALKEIFKDVPLTTYKIVKNNVVLSIKEPNVKPEANNLIEVPPPINITGTIKDAKTGESIVGVTVRIEGTSNGVITDVNGKFTLKIPKPDVVIVFSCVGYDVQRVVLKGQLVLGIRLMPSLSKLDEVVVVAYGTQKKISITGAVSSVDSKILKQSPSANFVGALAGRLPGLITIQNSGQPGTEGFAIYLRGASTTNGQNPLILIDGVPRDNITSLDFNEVASVSILKDASSTAVFGVRGANGVILITTKRGTTGTPQLNFSVEYGSQDNTRHIQTMDSWDYAKYKNEALINDGLLPKYSQESIDKYKNGVDRFMYPNTNWYDLLMRKSAPLSRYNLNVSGGNDRVKYFVNANYTHQGGMTKTESKEKLGYDPRFKMDRYNFRTNLDINVNSWIKSTVNLAGYIEKVNTQGGTDGNPLYAVYGIYFIPPTMPGPVTIPGYGVPADEVISYNDGNPSFGRINRCGYINTERSNLNSSLALDFDLKRITKGLTSKVMISFDSKSTSITKAIKEFVKYDFTLKQVQDPVTGLMKDELTFVPRQTPQFYPISLSKSTSFAYTMNLQWMLNFERTINVKHHLTGMLLAQRDNSEAVSGSSDQLLPYNVLGVSGRATYGYDNRYLMELNVGYNGSEQFQSERRFGFFPALSLGWVISNERFMKAQNVITNLKLRASYGKVGNDKLGNDRFLYLDNVSVGGGGFSGSLGQGKYINEDLIGNPLITWETSYKQNYGLEFRLLKNLSFTGDLFYENREDILLTRGIVPALQGLPLNVVPKMNIGKVSNKGYELELVYNKQINKDLSFVIRGNYNFNKNIVKNIDEPPYDATYPFVYNRTGYSLSQNWGYKIDWESIGKGYFTSQEEITNSGYIFNGIQPKPGDFVYKDLNDDNIIDNKDQAPIKYGFVPRVTYGANLSVSYKGFDFAVLIQGVAQTSQYYSSWGVFETPGPGNYYDYHRSAWTIDRFTAGEKITYPRLSSTGSSSLTANDFFIMDRSYIRFKNVEIGNTLPERWSKRIGTQKIRIYANGQNIFVWDKLPTRNFDPEQASSTSMPINLTFNCGVNIVF